MSRRKSVTDEEIVESRLRQFINKYYRIKIFQGLVITFSIALFVFALLIIFGYLAPAGKWVRHSAFYIGAAGVLAAIILFIGKPLAQRLGFIRGLNFKEASNIIRQKHKSIEDRIINIIELTREKAGQDNKLYDYAIAQKTDKIRDFNFEEAVSFRKLGLFLGRMLVLAAVCTGIFLLWPDFVRKGFGEMWVVGEKAGSFNHIEFSVLNDALEVESGEDFLLRFRVSSAMPLENVRVRIGSNEERAEQKGDDYEYLFKAVNSSVSFRLAANLSQSGEYVLKALLKPEIAGIRLKILPPAYTELESTVIDGYGNAEVPWGSKIGWTIKTVNTDELMMIVKNDTAALIGKGNNWTAEKGIIENTDYELLCKNKNGLYINYFYKISIVKDLFPTIDISESRDSTIANEVFIQGVIQDDYGFSKLEIIENKLGKESSKEIGIKKEAIFENFYYTLIPDSNSTVYYFRIWDNDRVEGPKFSDSRKIALKTISKEEIENLNTRLVDSIKSNMLDGMNSIDKMEKKISQFKMEQILGDLKPWEIQEKIKELNELKKEVVDFLNNISKNDKEFTDNEQMLNQDSELTEKARQLQELMQSLLDDEMKELLKQFEELAREFNANKAEELTEKMEMNLEKLKEQMEMSLELLKKYDMEKNLLQQVEKLNEMADSLDNSKNEGANEENRLKEDFKKWEDEYENNLKKDQEFKKPMGLEKLEPEREEVRKAADGLDKDSKEGSQSEKKSKASKGLRNLAKKMKNMLGNMGGEGEFIDLEDMRQIRNSLNDFSKRQEELNNRISRIVLVNPVFTVVIKEQKTLEDKFVSVRDSLKSMGYKQPVIAKVVGQELFHVETSFKNLFESYSGNRINVVRIEQNRIMTDINSIAVKLDELISQMESAQGSGSGEKGFTDRKKPKSGEQKGSDKIGETKSMQQSLKEQLRNSIEKMKSGATGKKERNDLARMLGEREMMRKALEKVLQDGGLGTEARQKANEALNMMKEVEKDIIYNKLGDNTLEKDNLIKTKLLDAENAEKERENENRRESKEFKGSFEPNRRELDNGTGQNKDMEQMLKYKELKLKRFYQDKYLKYIESTKK